MYRRTESSWSCWITSPEQDRVFFPFVFQNFSLIVWNLLGKKTGLLLVTILYKLWLPKLNIYSHWWLAGHNFRPWAVTKSENFWWATGQSNLVYKSQDAKKASKVVSYSHNCTVVSGTVFHSVCQVWLCSGKSSGCETSLWSVNNSDGNIFEV